MKTQNELQDLKNRANSIMPEIIKTLAEHTANKPIVLITGEEDEETLSDKVWDLPIGYYVGKYEDYVQGAVKKVQGDDVELFITAEGMYGEEWNCSLDSLPYWSLVELLNYLD